MEPHNLSSVAGTPAPEIDIDQTLVYRLLKEQHPDLADLSIHPVSCGWDNAIFRLGEQLSIRLPRRQLGAMLIEHEQTWLPQLAKGLQRIPGDHLPIPVPTPVRLGKPSPDYPWRWSILPWLSGVTADQQELVVNQAERFAAFLRSLHIPAPAHAPHNQFRGVPLSHRQVDVEVRMKRLKATTNLITSEIQQIWHQALAAPIDILSTWLHGDLHPHNILVAEGLITGVIDWGDLTAGDRATDLAAIWMLFSDADLRQRTINAYAPISEATWQRAKGWAVFFGVVLLETGLVDNPQQAAIGEKTLRHLLEDV
ncbi:MAG: aminoglycoside phosphotransferase family protein [Acaryochloris sp. RU_4_1]|nr:aminoglycoside phosphotransferase family protein [Acaryochloris sp. RU_4_1]NJR55990.1 aminoglycoside phosphotransferase family protein [Acaryochloris sp. CRU_2_0]